MSPVSFDTTCAAPPFLYPATNRLSDPVRGFEPRSTRLRGGASPTKFHRNKIWAPESNRLSPRYQRGASPSMLAQSGTAGGNRTRVFCLEGRVLSLSDTAAWNTHRDSNPGLRLGKAPCGHQHFGCKLRSRSESNRRCRGCNPVPSRLGDAIRFPVAGFTSSGFRLTHRRPRCWVLPGRRDSRTRRQREADHSKATPLPVRFG